MAITLPLPVRVAAGILATGINVVRSLPEDIPAIPVALVGNAMRLSMKVQQEIATLATRGDELLGGVIGAPQENPSWAKFDDDEPATPAPKPTARTTLQSAPEPTDDPVGAEKSVGGETEGDSEKGDNEKGGIDKKAASKVASAARSRPSTEALDPDTHGLTTPEESSVAPGTTTAIQAALEVPEVVIEQVIGADPGAETDVHPTTESGAPESARSGADPATEAGPTPVQAAEPDRAAEPDQVAEPDQAAVPSQASDTDDPPALPGYQRMTLAQVRGHLRELSAGEVTALLQYEQSADNRAPFLTLLSNRLVTLDAQPS